MNRIVALTFVVILGLIVGCSSFGKGTTSRPGALDVSASAPIPPAKPVAAQPIVDTQPIMYSPAPTAGTASLNSGAAASKSYTVKKGDTLFSIAKTNYGTGRDWQKIASANPGVTPSKLKVGQQIVIP
ncbi:MAG: LysM peptidoglycan-binding domain-containing protein [Burkholderiales bacterium]|nr:LysM peptidoglycan-binding domain-containing protein [Phycisphaerae bacterium]